MPIALSWVYFNGYCCRAFAHDIKVGSKKAHPVMECAWPPVVVNSQMKWYDGDLYVTIISMLQVPDRGD